MPPTEPRLVESGPLPYLLSVPAGAPPEGAGWPLLCFLHGYDEGAPTPVREGITAHGPLAASAAPLAREEFVVVGPQLPVQGDGWHRHPAAVEEIVRGVAALQPVDPARCYLTGFSFGGNGVFDLGARQRGLWAALWAVDPTRVPAGDPERPVWVSAGEVSRWSQRGFVQRLGAGPPGAGEPGDRVYEDRGVDHVGTARLAYAEERIYRWLLARRLPDPAP